MTRASLRRRRLLVGAALTLLGTAVFCVILFRPPTWKEVALRGLRAVERRDAALLLSILTRSEIERAELDGANLRRFLEDFVAQRMQGFAPRGKPTFDVFPDTGQLVARQQYVHPDGRSIVMDITAAATPEGPRLSSGLCSITLCVLSTALPAGQALPQGRAKFALCGSELREALPALQSTGIAGLTLQGNPSGVEEFYTFSQFADRFERMAQGEAAP